MVLVAHLWPSSSAVAIANTLGIIGVELFFVLSGFLIGGILIRQLEEGGFTTWRSWLQFLSRRWFRTLPNYYLFLLAQIGWRAYVIGFPDVLVAQLSFFVFCQSPLNFFFPESWSLCVEEWFYLGFSFSLWIGRVFFKDFKIVLVGMISMFWILPVVLRLVAVVEMAQHEGVDMARVWDTYLRKTTLFRLDALMYGVAAAAIAQWYPHGWRTRGRYWPFVMGLLTAVACSLALGFPLDRAQPIQGLLLWPLISMSLVGLLPWASGYSPKSESSGSRSIRFIARISYSLYLAHGLVVIAVHHLFRYSSNSLLAKHSFGWSMLCLTLSVLLASATYFWFEKPTTAWRERIPSR
jgi:peptidoglycan/LPS O-acetylase OafA/YrhL